jgi:CheY-like chemotaxis protein
VIAPTRALVVEDIDTWVYTLTRAARNAGASEVIQCTSLQAVRDKLRSYRFDIAILDIGLDPDNDVNADGIQALKAIREADGDSTRCVLVTGWQGGDRMALQSAAQLDHGVDFAFMKEKYDAPVIVAKLTDLLARSSERRLAQGTAMANLAAKMDPPFRFENWLLNALSPAGGIQSVYKLVPRLLNAVTPAVASRPEMPLEKGPDGISAGLYWSRALGCAIGVGLAPATAWAEIDDAVPAVLARMLPREVVPARIANVHERNIAGHVWEMPGIDRDQFPVK